MKTEWCTAHLPMHASKPLLVIAVLFLSLLSPAYGHGGGLHAWDFNPESHGSQPHARLASCSSFQPYEPDLATSAVTSFHRTPGQLSVQGSIDVYVYLDNTCRHTSALLPTLKLMIETQGDEAVSGGLDQQQRRKPLAHMATAAYGFRGLCESGLVGIYEHHLLAGLNRHNLLWWHDAHTDSEGGLHGISPSGANTYPRQPKSDAISVEGTPLSTDPAELSSTALQSILLVPAEGPLFCCNLDWETEYKKQLADAQAACAPVPPSAESAAEGHHHHVAAATGVMNTSTASMAHGEGDGHVGVHEHHGEHGEELQDPLQQGAGQQDTQQQQATHQQQELQLQESQKQDDQQQQQQQQQVLGQQRRRQLALGTAMPSASAPETCPDTPTAPECASYEYPEARAEQDLDTLCSAMPDMPGCSLRNSCKAHKLSDVHVCHYMVVLATICEDMPGMGGCKTYNRMCSEGSSIEECSKYPPVRRMPSWSKSRQAVFDMCKDHPMQQCESCTQSNCPDPLASLSGACTDMPDMPECAIYDRWCQANSDGRLAYYCGSGEGGGSSSGLPSMLMYFHERVSETVLWRSWVTKTYGGYIGTVITVILFGVASIAIKTCVTMLSIWWKVQACYAHEPISPSSSSSSSAPSPSLLCCWLPKGSQWWQNAIKAALSGISITFDYWNMLIAMTFNVGLFCAVIGGYMLGAFLFASVSDNFAAHVQTMTPSDVYMDCEYPKPSFRALPGDENENGSRAGSPLNHASKAKSCSKGGLQQGEQAALLSRGGDIEASKRTINCGIMVESYTTPSCCPDIH